MKSTNYWSNISVRQEVEGIEFGKHGNRTFKKTTWRGGGGMENGMS